MGSRTAKSIGLLVLLVLLLVPGCGDGSRPGRIIVLGLDGLDPQTVDLLLSEGKRLKLSIPSAVRLSRHR